MANLAKEMLKIAGYDARLTWLGTRRLAYDYSTPSLAVDNHVICTVFLDGKRYFLDPTEEYISFGDHAYRIQGRQVLIEDGENYILDTIPEYDMTHNTVEINKQFELDQKLLKGTIKETYYGERKTQILRAYSNIRNDEKKKSLRRFLDNGDKSITVSSIKTSDFNDRSKPFSVNYSAEINHQVDEFEKDLYISLETDYELGKFDFDSTRRNDYLFSNKYLKKVKVEFEIPLGYKVKHIPENLDKEHENFFFKVNYKETNGKIIYTKQLAIKHAEIKKTEFVKWNEFVKALKQRYDDRIILTKAYQ